MIITVIFVVRSVILLIITIVVISMLFSFCIFNF